VLFTGSSIMYVVLFTGSSIMYVVLFTSRADITFSALYLGYFLIAFSSLI
jgi:hypothetical protein